MRFQLMCIQIKIDCLNLFSLQILSPHRLLLSVMVPQIFFVKIVWTIRTIAFARNPFNHILHEPRQSFQRIDNFSKPTIICTMSVITIHQRTGSVLHTWKPHFEEDVVNRSVYPVQMVSLFPNFFIIL